MLSDIINSCFEAIGAVIMWMNVKSILKDKEFKGASLSAMIFFVLWSIWNVPFYWSLKQTWSMIFAVILLMGHVTWVYLVFYYYFKKKKYG